MLYQIAMTTRFTYAPLAAALLAVLFVLPAKAQDMETPRPQRLVSVNGEGVVRVEPDRAIVRFGIVTRDADPEAARRRNAEAAAEAMNAVRALGVEDRKIRLEQLSLQPAREYDPETRQWKEVGFEAVRQVVVTLDDLETLPVLVAEVVQKGANRLDGVTYDLQSRDAARNEALVEAVRNAREKAQLLVETLGAGLGPVQNISEQSFDFPRPMMQFARAEAALTKDEAAPEPDAYAAGEIEVRATVSATFVIE